MTHDWRTKQFVSDVEQPSADDPLQSIHTALKRYDDLACELLRHERMWPIAGEVKIGDAPQYLVTFVAGDERTAEFITNTDITPARIGVLIAAHAKAVLVALEHSRADLSAIFAMRLQRLVDQLDHALRIEPHANRGLKVQRGGAHRSGDEADRLEELRNQIRKARDRLGNGRGLARRIKQHLQLRHDVRHINRILQSLKKSDITS